MGNREEFEAMPEIKDLIDRGVVFFNKHKENYDGLRGDYARGAWLAWQARVPEGYVVMPIKPTFKQIDALKNSCEVLRKTGLSDLEANGAYKAVIEAVEK